MRSRILNGGLTPTEEGAVMTNNHPPEMIEPQVLYSLNEAMVRTGLGKSAFRQARRSGLPVRYVSKRGYVLGKDLIDWVVTNSKQQP